ncbi:MAG: HAMP domain-containing protein [Bacteroidetes bacterium]|nr:HAMP domain-containing protein [Bacteroidota bacterium]
MVQDRFRRRHLIFWRVSAALVIVQLATGLLAIGLSAYLASDRSADLAENSLRVRIDALAEEIERAGAFSSEGLKDLAPTLLSNLSLRFPDPIIVADTSGVVLHTIYPISEAFSGDVADSSMVPVLPPTYARSIGSGEISIDRKSELVKGGFAVSPLYDASGLLIGGYIIQPIERSISRELAPTREAFQTALFTVILVSILLAVALAAVFSWWMVRPLKRMTARVFEIGSGNYEARVQIKGSDEIAQLGATINQMAAQVAESVEALQTTDRMRRELVANVGHDLRTPLAALRGHIEEALRFHGENRTDESQNALNAAQRQAAYLNKMVDDLFELSQLENPSPQLRSEPVLIAELLHEVARSHVGQLSNKAIVLVTDIPSTLPVVQADGVRLKRLLDNLLSNAKRHTDAGGRISLLARYEDNQLIIEVSDSGEGMDAESLSYIFDRYYRGEASRTRDEHGTGLGLAISRAIAELHGGSLEAESTPGVGTSMRLTLPVVDPDALT